MVGNEVKLSNLTIETCIKACLKVTESHNLPRFFATVIKMGSETGSLIFIAVLFFVIAAIPIYIMGYEVRKYGYGTVYRHLTEYIIGAVFTLLFLGGSVTAAVFASIRTEPEEIKLGNAPHIAPNLL